MAVARGRVSSAPLRPGEFELAAISLSLSFSLIFSLSVSCSIVAAVLLATVRTLRCRKREREIERKLAGNLENVNSKREMEINIGEVRRRRLSAPFCERASFFERAIFFVASGGCCWRRAAGFSFAYNLRGRGKFKGGARSTGREWRPQFIFVFSFLEWGKGKMCFLRRGI